MATYRQLRRRRATSHQKLLPTRDTEAPKWVEVALLRQDLL